jgi:hypothetical protein
MSDLDDFLERARREMFPKMKGSAMSMMIVDEPDPKLCLELGAAILFDKPILCIVPKGRHVPLALRTIAHRIIEVDNPPTETDGRAIVAAANELIEAGRFRGRSQQ